MCFAVTSSYFAGAVAGEESTLRQAPSRASRRDDVESSGDDSPLRQGAGGEILNPLMARETHVRWEPQEEGVMRTAASFTQ